MSGRRPREVEVYLWRRAGAGVEVALLRRAPALGGFWHCVAGAVEPGESDGEAAARELREETGLAVEVADSGVRYAYPVDADRRHLFAGDVSEIAVACFTAEVPRGARVVLDWEHDELAWHPLERAGQVLRHAAVADAMARTVAGAAQCGPAARAGTRA